MLGVFVRWIDQVIDVVRPRTVVFETPTVVQIVTRPEQIFPGEDQRWEVAP